MVRQRTLRRRRRKRTNSRRRSRQNLSSRHAGHKLSKRKVSSRRRRRRVSSRRRRRRVSSRRSKSMRKMGGSRHNIRGGMFRRAPAPAPAPPPDPNLRDNDVKNELIEPGKDYKKLDDLALQSNERKFLKITEKEVGYTELEARAGLVNLADWKGIVKQTGTNVFGMDILSNKSSIHSLNKSNGDTAHIRYLGNDNKVIFDQQINIEMNTCLIRISDDFVKSKTKINNKETSRVVMRINLGERDALPPASSRPPLNIGRLPPLLKEVKNKALAPDFLDIKYQIADTATAEGVKLNNEFGKIFDGQNTTGSLTNVPERSVTYDKKMRRDDETTWPPVSSYTSFVDIELWNKDGSVGGTGNNLFHIQMCAMQGTEDTETQRRELDDARAAGGALPLSLEEKWKNRLQLTSPLYVGVEYYIAGAATKIVSQKNWLQQNQNRINFSFIYKYMAPGGATSNVKLVIENMSNILKPEGSDFKDDFLPVLTKLQNIFQVDDITNKEKVGGKIDMKLGRTIFFVKGTDKTTCHGAMENLLKNEYFPIEKMYEWGRTDRSGNQKEQTRITSDKTVSSFGIGREAAGTRGQDSHPIFIDLGAEDTAWWMAVLIGKAAQSIRSIYRTDKKKHMKKLNPKKFGYGKFKQITQGGVLVDTFQYPGTDLDDEEYCKKTDGTDYANSSVIQKTDWSSARLIYRTNENDEKMTERLKEEKIVDINIFEYATDKEKAAAKIKKKIKSTSTTPMTIVNVSIDTDTTVHDEDDKN